MHYVTTVLGSRIRFPARPPLVRLRGVQYAHRKVVRDGYDMIAEGYLAARPRDGEDVAILRELIASLPHGAAVLDAGCGAGEPVGLALADAGLTAVGLDFSSGQLRLARSNAPTVPGTQADLAALPFRDHAFQAVVSYYAIIHVPRADHATIFDELQRVLEPAGLALLCLGAHDIPNDHDPESWLGTAMYWSHFDAATNLRMLREAGFDILWDRIVADPMDHSEHLFALARARSEGAS